MIAFRHNELVYVPITKHASSTYTELFKNRLGWQQVQTDSIDWDSDHVFAHIINPYTRHLKGTVEALLKYKLTDMIDDPRFAKLLTTAVFDLHSYPLTATFGIEQMVKIDWLMLDHSKFSGNRLTTKFLQDNGVTISESDIPQLNISNEHEKKLTSNLQKLRTDLDLVGTLTYFYENDIVIYNQVERYTAFYNLDTRPWGEISWLTNRNKSD